MPLIAGGLPGADAGATVLDAAAAQRLWWRVGFGPRPGDLERTAGRPLGDVLGEWLDAPITYSGPPGSNKGRPFKPKDEWGHDHCVWLDRMVRVDAPLRERLALVWHDWFATSNDGVDDSLLMLEQTQMLRDHGLGSFRTLTEQVTSGRAMLVWLNGIDNDRWTPNENYARELMELFTLGVDRGYRERDVREAARALTGFRADWSPRKHHYNFRYDPKFHDNGLKRIFGQQGRFGWQDVVRLCVEHPQHASFFCLKLWSAFIPTPPDAATLGALGQRYVDSGRAIRPVLEAILLHPQLIAGPSMIVPPAVYCAGLLRGAGRWVADDDWAWLSEMTGQFLYHPPNVAGWNDQRWLDTSTVVGRWAAANHALRPIAIDPETAKDPARRYDPDESPQAAVDRALATLGGPIIGPQERAAHEAYARAAITGDDPNDPIHRSYQRVLRQNGLRMLIATAPERFVC